jgi:hypothetical protein
MRAAPDSRTGLPFGTSGVWQSQPKVLGVGGSLPRLECRIQDKRTINKEGTRWGLPGEYPGSDRLGGAYALVGSRWGCVASVDSVAAAPFAGRNAAKVLPEPSDSLLHISF